MKECDLIMKGGITSGIVYSKMVTKLSKEYRFVNIGGASAGAIAAGLAASAEYYRQKHDGSTAGFEFLDDIPDEIGDNLLSLFQPSRENKRLFRFFLKLMEGMRKGWGKGRFIWHALFNTRTLLNSTDNLSSNYFGMCNGMTQGSSANSKTMALTDWLNNKIEQCAGRLKDGRPSGAPLTFGDLEKRSIKLRIVTTNLSQKTPVCLPKISFALVKVEDLKALMPNNVVEYIHDCQEELKGNLDTDTMIPSEFYILPKQEKMPVILAVRMSLSFPLLLSALPLYHFDFSLRNCEEEQSKPKQCWYSDGGITINFPIHFFDSIFPCRPTFGINLGEFHECRQDTDNDPENPFPKNRVYLPKNAGQGRLPDVNEIDGLLGFISSIFYSAQSWQYTSQSQLSGYRERISRIYLKTKDGEGGINIEMNKEQVDALVEIGIAASETIVEDFDLNEHRWRRLLSGYAAIEKTFESLVDDYKREVAGDDPEILHQAIAEFITKYSTQAGSYKPDNDEVVTEIHNRFAELITIAEKWKKNPIRKKEWSSNGMPKPELSLKIVPERFQG